MTIAIRKKKVRTALAAVSCLLLAAAPVKSDTPEQAARDVLKSMADYVSGLDKVSMDYSSDIEAVMKSGIKLQFSASGQMTLDRPNAWRMTRTGGFADVELVSDGKTVTLYGKHKNVYAQRPAPESFDAFVNTAREKRGVALPGADLFLASVHKELTEPVKEALYLGTAMIDGVECEHLAFRTDEVDWQIWVATGGKPYPCKYVITTKDMDGAPQYQLRIRNWNDAPDVSDATFSFKPGEGAKKVDISAIGNTGIVKPDNK